MCASSACVYICDQQEAGMYKLGLKYTALEQETRKLKRRVRARWEIYLTMICWSPVFAICAAFGFSINQLLPVDWAGNAVNRIGRQLVITVWQILYYTYSLFILPIHVYERRPSDHYFRSVCLSVCLFEQSFSQPSLIRFRSNLDICYMSGSSCVP